MAAIPPMDEVALSIGWDLGGEECMLFEVVSRVKQRFDLDDEEATLVSYSAVSRLLAKGAAELSFGHWEGESIPVSPSELPSPNDSRHWKYPPPEERYTLNLETLASETLR